MDSIKETIEHEDSLGMARGREGKVKDVSMALSLTKKQGRVFSTEMEQVVQWEKKKKITSGV